MKFDISRLPFFPVEEKKLEPSLQIFDLHKYEHDKVQKAQSFTIFALILKKLDNILLSAYRI